MRPKRRSRTSSTPSTSRSSTRSTAKIEAANKSADEQYEQIRALDSQISKLDATAEGLDMERRFKKTELDSKRSLYDGMIDRAEEQSARVYLAQCRRRLSKT